MITKVHMEALSPTMEEGQLVKWHMAEGDEVANGDIVAEIETDKATMELVARGEGILRKIILQEGGTAPVGDVIAVIAGADEDIGDVVADTGGAAPKEAPAPAEKKREAAPPDRAEAARAKAEAGAPAPAAPAPAADADGGRVKASPLARRLADDLGLELGRIEGSGPGGRIVKRDVEAARESGMAAPAAAAAEDEYVDVPVSQMRKTIAKRLVESIGPVPHFFLTIDVDMGRVMEARKSLNALLEKDGEKVSINDILLKAVAGALRKHPDCNAQWHGTSVRRYNAVHLGVAVAIEEGLITPVVRDAHVKGIARIAREVRELAGRARERKLQPNEYTGSTFSVSNLGMFGIHEFTAIINPPEAGILAVGGIEDTPVVVDGQVVVRPRMRVTMSCDHRVIDGAQGSRFLATLKGMLEEPAAILL
ncbi:MAG TPA: pyruvate dehydrogenase complex dihydrolipoamide acetyltransferase [Longimicrobiales bacterium]|nr:pyruvate dehydrogenase complex dihydrolipoamide acetyltransferase [Longimicrobiales bacterium]